MVMRLEIDDTTKPWDILGDQISSIQHKSGDCGVVHQIEGAVKITVAHNGTAEGKGQFR